MGQGPGMVAESAGHLGVGGSDDRLVEQVPMILRVDPLTGEMPGGQPGQHSGEELTLGKQGLHPGAAVGATCRSQAICCATTSGPRSPGIVARAMCATATAEVTASNIARNLRTTPYRIRAIGFNHALADHLT